VVSQGGPVLTAPEVVPITFQGDPVATKVGPFLSQLAASQYWTNATAEYGVGRLKARPPLQFPDGLSAAFTDDDVQKWLQARIASTASFPQPAAGTIYTLFAPGSIVLSADTNSTGYHSSFKLADGRRAVYAVVSTAPSAGSTDGGTFDQATGTASHEIAEAATNPSPWDAPAFSDLDRDDTAWELLGDYGNGRVGGEVGDLCTVVALEVPPAYDISGNTLLSSTANAPGVLVDTPGVEGKVQRLWSNRAAAASHDPCQPYGLTPYFNSAPVLDDIVTATDSAGHAFSTRGVRIAVGETRSVEIDLFSDAPTAPWTLAAYDSLGPCGPTTTVSLIGPPPPIGEDAGPTEDAPSAPLAVPGPAPPLCLSYSLDSEKGKNGDKVHLTITVNHPLPGGQAMITLQNVLGAETTRWPIVVVN
jgi:hypothetical protein